uniref:RNA-dependent RNA polymerase n=1 Tax=Caloscypha fulgens partitivirus 4 TaxID=2778762 RepID=A0A7L8Y9A8_9VIRU|nr:RNA-dependent RNA polymerase [Caloscypha fulgens partitivirus 4]
MEHLRNLLAETRFRIASRWQNFGKSNPLSESELRSAYQAQKTDAIAEILDRVDESTYHQYLSDIQETSAQSSEPFEFYSLPHEGTTIPENRLPAPGIRHVPLFYHRGRIVHQVTPDRIPDRMTEDSFESTYPGDSDFGYPIDPLILILVSRKYPEYMTFVHKYCRPAGTTDATFKDFNKPQVHTHSDTPEHRDKVLHHILLFTDSKPYSPLHYVDTQYAKLPLTTGTGYHNRHSYKIRTLARFTRPDEYAHRPQSKGYFYNAQHLLNRNTVHNLKNAHFPYHIDRTYTDHEYSRRWNVFINEHPTILFTRNHISQRDGILKVRPVYAVDDLFLTIEVMLTFPLLVQMRKPSSCLMYGLETIRGSNVFLDQIAQIGRYLSFFTIDWSGFDQALPFYIVLVYYTVFLPQLIVISAGYQQTYDYDSTHLDNDEHAFFTKMFNLLTSLITWYVNMTFLSADGHAYRRTFAGVPSGLFNTQMLDSFGNLYLLIDGMLAFKLTDSDIQSILLFVLGDDNSGFTHWTIAFLESFITFFESYSKERWNMTLSKTKSVITPFRNKIETLAYQCNFGRPRRPIGKLVAQLCYPEHGAKPSTMSARAIGMAYASCAQDKTFHDFCRDVYYTFLPYAELDPASLSKNRAFLPNFFKLFEESDIYIDFSHFPTLIEISDRISRYAGPLGFEPKWNKSHFVNDPDVVPPNSKTMFEYMNEHNVQFPDFTPFETV